MLVLGRKLGESIVVGNGITITVVSIRGGRVRLGVECSPEIPVHRAEVQRLIEKELETACACR